MGNGSPSSFRDCRDPQAAVCSAGARGRPERAPLRAAERSPPREENGAAVVAPVRLDPASSARWFEGWKRKYRTRTSPRPLASDPRWRARRPGSSPSVGDGTASSIPPTFRVEPRRAVPRPFAGPARSHGHAPSKRRRAAPRRSQAVSRPSTPVASTSCRQATSPPARSPRSCPEPTPSAVAARDAFHRHECAARGAALVVMEPATDSCGTGPFARLRTAVSRRRERAQPDRITIPAFARANGLARSVDVRPA